MTRAGRGLDAETVHADQAAQRFAHLVADLPSQSRHAWQLGGAVPLPPSFQDIRRVVIFGMGGSEAGGDAVASLARLSSHTTVDVVRGHSSPLVNDHTLAIGSSFSGNTVETLTALRAALEMGAHAFVMSAGGELLDFARARDLPYLAYDWDGPPRTAFGYSFYAPLAVLSRLGIVRVTDRQVQDSLAGLERGAASWNPTIPMALNEAKPIAQRTAGRIPVILGPSWLGAASRRWAAQINENAKQLAFALDLPEAVHNFVEGFGALNQHDEIRAIVLTSTALDPRDQRVVEVLAGLIATWTGDLEVVPVRGDDPLSAVASASYLGDWVSYYLAVLGHVDPNELHWIEPLKRQLRSQEF
ncbi:MAG TPA: SIS domain-containing protein [Dehalococcoidia bacterium]|nr:SIS domain-containing protein [Dehalococcoidia bacterium]